MFLSFVLEHGGKRAEMCGGNRWKGQTLVLFLIYTSVLTTDLASKDEEKTFGRYLSILVLFGDVYLTISNSQRIRVGLKKIIRP